LSHLIKTERWAQVLVFTRTKHGANRLAEQLLKDGIAAMAIHGNKSQTARTKALAEFKKGDLRVLVATDIAARGIDISELPHVVNYELPNVPEDYVHRIGRTGRAGANGEAISLVCVDELDFLRNIERLTKRSLPREKVDGFEPDPNARAQPIQLRSQQNRAAPARGAHAGKGRPGGKASQPASARPGGSKPFGGKPGSARPGTRSGSAHRSGGRHR
ncbi:MAG: RNA helicase, partial [Thioalkalivibrio sp.]|nr:RNA helicase [Thioalkalivibrio sp.]